MTLKNTKLFSKNHKNKINKTKYTRKRRMDQYTSETYDHKWKRTKEQNEKQKKTKIYI